MTQASIEAIAREYVRLINIDDFVSAEQCLESLRFYLKHVDDVAAAARAIAGNVDTPYQLALRLGGHHREKFASVDPIDDGWNVVVADSGVRCHLTHFGLLRTR